MTLFRRARQRVSDFSKMKEKMKSNNIKSFNFDDIENNDDNNEKNNG